MKAWLIAAGAIAAGVAAALATNWYEFARLTNTYPQPPTSAVAGQEPAAAGQPQAEVVNGAIHDFGSMHRYGQRSHVFLIKNVGDAPLQLTEGETTCRCTISELENGFVPPGKTAEINLKWKATELGPNYRYEQVAEIITNDPRQKVLRLTVRGRVADTLIVDPQDLRLDRISANATNTVQFRLLASEHDDLMVSGHDFQNQATSDRYELKFRPLTSEELKAARYGKSGIMATVTIKPGLPLGTINQTILLTTNLPDEPELEVPVQGRVISDISILGGRYFNLERNLLTLGAVEQSQGRRVVLHLLVKGPHRNDVKLSIGEIIPKNALLATIGPGEQIGQEGSVIKYPLTVEVPAGAPQVSYMSPHPNDAARIVIRTTHPKAKEVLLLVRFAVQG